MLSALNTYSNETRKAEYFVLPAPDLSQAPVPSDDAVKSFYEMRKDAYRTPEYRQVNVLVASPVEIARTLPISDEAARRSMTRPPAQRFTVPEKRSGLAAELFQQGLGGKGVAAHRRGREFRRGRRRQEFRRRARRSRRDDQSRHVRQGRGRRRLRLAAARRDAPRRRASSAGCWRAWRRSSRAR